MFDKIRLLQSLEQYKSDIESVSTGPGGRSMCSCAVLDRVDGDVLGSVQILAYVLGGQPPSKIE